MRDKSEEQKGDFWDMISLFMNFLVFLFSVTFLSTPLLFWEEKVQICINLVRAKKCDKV